MFLGFLTLFLRYDKAGIQRRIHWKSKGHLVAKRIVLFIDLRETMQDEAAGEGEIVNSMRASEVYASDLSFDLP